MNNPQNTFKHMLDFMIKLSNELCFFQTKEGKLCGTATNSEIRRWFQNKAIVVNGVAANFNDPVPEVWESLVLFPKSQARRCTLW